MLISLDVETRSITDDKDDALYPHLSEITIVGLWCPEFETTFTDLVALQKFIDDNPSYVFLGHNFQFDLKHLENKGVRISYERWAHDTRLMASACTQKIPESWLKGYEERRKELNKELPTGYSHRAARGQSLKTLAPYFLKVKPFWEDPTDHSTAEYVLKDCEYTYRLYEKFKDLMLDDKTLEFYQTFLMPKARLFQAAIARGMFIDLPGLQENWLKEIDRCTKLKDELDIQWKSAYEHYREKQVIELKHNYSKKLEAAITKAKDVAKVIQRYKALEDAAIEKLEPLNLDSPTQLNWLFKEYFNYDITDFNGKESTGKEVLAKLSKEHKDVKTFVDYRKSRKLITSFYPTLEKLQDEQVIRCSVNLDGTRTGRTSCSDPNLQQQPPQIKPLFIARPGYKLITLDESSIEPRIIAFITEDPILCDLMINNGDFHSRNAVVMFGLDCKDEEVKDKHPIERKIAKELGLALLYGAGPRRIQQSAQKYGFMWSLGYCKEIFENFKSLYENVYKYKKSLDKRAEAGHPIENVFGRKIVYTNPEDVYMKAFNTLIQGSASDLLIEACDNAAKKYKENQIDAHLLITVHDEAVFEAVDEQADLAYSILKEEMTKFKLTTKFGNIPLEVEGGISKEWKK